MKRKREVEDLSRKAERLEREADRAEQLAKEEAAVVEAMAEELRKRQAALKAREEAAASARRSAIKARREVACHELPAARAKPKSIWNTFVNRQQASLQVCAEMWSKMSSEEKKSYQVIFDEEMKAYQVWVNSEEGREILAKRREVLETQQATAARATELRAPAPNGSEPNEVGHVSPAKRARPSEPKPTPVKTRSKAPINTGPAIEEAVLEEASRLSMSEQLLNLASRPEIQALKKGSQELLEALKGSGGMVNAAKRTLMGDAA